MTPTFADPTALPELNTMRCGFSKAASVLLTLQLESVMLKSDLLEAIPLAITICHTFKMRRTGLFSRSVRHGGRCSSTHKRTDGVTRRKRGQRQSTR